MKHVLIQIVFFAILLGNLTSIRAWAEGSGFPAPELVKVSSDAVFAPPGFDDNDNAQIVIHGELINTCYKVALPAVSVDRINHLITVSAQAYFYSGCWCLQIMVPYTQTIDLGPLPKGKYRVVEFNPQGSLIHDVSLPVGAAASAASDDLLYAPVKHAKILRGTGDSPETLILTGIFGSDCMEMQEVRVFHRVPHIIEVLPIAAHKAGMSCQPHPTPFETQVSLPVVESGETLIYIRSLNGQAISEVEYF